jgi:hypothetical protein
MSLWCVVFWGRRKLRKKEVEEEGRELLLM